MKNFARFILAIIISVNCYNPGFAQDSTKSLAFKDDHPYIKAPYFYRPDFGYQIWQQFKLTREANSGDVLAQHELGLRYLLGEGVAADTAKAVYWIKKAADQNLASAKYNFGILLINGWGVDWNPFSAFKYFMEAARAGMIQAQYIVGILYTDNLIVKRDFNYAFYWVRKSSDEGYKPAKEVINKLKPEISLSVVDSITALEDKKPKNDIIPIEEDDNANLSSPVGLVFIDFKSGGDTITAISDSMLIRDLRYADVDSLNTKFKLDSLKSLVELTKPEILDKLIEFANNGCPEAQTILGKMYESGLAFKRNQIISASYYFQALRNDSQKASYLLWKMSKSKEFIKSVQALAQQNNAEAMFVWYGLNSINFDNQIAMNDALNLLQKASNQNYIPAIIELGLDYYTGKYSVEDQQKGLALWNKAENLGSIEAKVRILSSSIHDQTDPENLKYIFKELKDAAENGSVLAQVSLAYCYENGIGTSKSKSNSVEYYRNAAQRGNQYAYRELERLYDEIRPDDPEFRLN